MRLHIVWTIFCKEMREALRDRITLLVLIGLPVLIYPLGMFSSVEVMKSQAAAEDRRVFQIAAWGPGGTALFTWLQSTNSRIQLERWRGAAPALRTSLEESLPHWPHAPGASWSSGPVTPTNLLNASVLEAAREAVSRRQADAVLILWPGFDEALERADAGKVSICYDSVVSRSAQAHARLTGELNRFREHLRQERQRERQLPEGFIRALEVSEKDLAPVQRRMSDVLGQILPLFLIMLSVVGAIVAAADMTAGEKERATMQTLLVAPVRSGEIVAGKFLAVWSISLVCALANLGGLGLTISRVAATQNVESIPWGTLAAALALLLPATWTIAALFLAVAVLGRDLKDAGNFLGALALVVMLPAGASLLPGVELDAWTSCVPLLNLALLIRTLLTGVVTVPLAVLTVVASLVYAGLALAFAARVFGRDQTLLGGAFSWRWLFLGERSAHAVPTPGLVLFVFPLVAVAMFYASLALAAHGLVLTLLVTHYGILLLFPVAVSLARGFPLARTFSLRVPHWRSFLGSILIGLSAAVAIAGLVLRLAPPPESMLREMEDLLRLGEDATPLWQLLVLLALTPALCEETLFRGFLLSGLRRWGPWAAIGLSALFFGILHGSVYRFLPTFVLGLLLGYTAWRSGSLYCSMLIHALNNGLIAYIAWRSQGHENIDMQTVPWSLTLIALAVTATGVALLRPARSEAG